MQEAAETESLLCQRSSSFPIAAARRGLPIAGRTCCCWDRQPPISGHARRMFATAYVGGVFTATPRDAWKEGIMFQTSRKAGLTAKTSRIEERGEKRNRRAKRKKSPAQKIPARRVAKQSTGVLLCHKKIKKRAFRLSIKLLKVIFYRLHIRVQFCLHIAHNSQSRQAF